MLGNGHVRFGGRVGETDRRQRRHRAPARPDPSSTWVIAVFSGESVRRICSAMNPAVCFLIAWAWVSVPRTSTTKTSA